MKVLYWVCVRMMAQIPKEEEKGYIKHFWRRRGRGGGVIKTHEHMYFSLGNFFPPERMLVFPLKKKNKLPKNKFCCSLSLCKEFKKDLLN